MSLSGTQAAILAKAIRAGRVDAHLRHGGDTSAILMYQGTITSSGDAKSADLEALEQSGYLEPVVRTETWAQYRPTPAGRAAIAAIRALS